MSCRKHTTADQRAAAPKTHTAPWPRSRRQAATPLPGLAQMCYAIGPEMETHTEEPDRIQKSSPNVTEDQLTAALENVKSAIQDKDLNYLQSFAEKESKMLVQKILADPLIVDMALEPDKVAVAKLLLDKGVDPNSYVYRMSGGLYPSIFKVVEIGDAKLFQAWVDHGANVNDVIDKRYTVLWWCIVQKKFEMAQYLLTKGVVPSPLLVEELVQQKDQASVQMLYWHISNPEKYSKEFVWWAAEYDWSEDIQKDLMERMSRNDYDNLLSKALNSGYVALVELMLPYLEKFHIQHRALLKFVLKMKDKLTRDATQEEIDRGWSYPEYFQNPSTHGMKVPTGRHLVTLDLEPFKKGVFLYLLEKLDQEQDWWEIFRAVNDNDVHLAVMKKMEKIDPSGVSTVLQSTQEKNVLLELVRKTTPDGLKRMLLDSKVEDTDVIREILTKLTLKEVIKVNKNDRFTKNILKRVETENHDMKNYLKETLYHDNPELTKHLLDIHNYTETEFSDNNLFFLLSTCSPDILDIFLEKGYEKILLNYRSYINSTFLMLTLENNNGKMAIHLLKKGLGNIHASDDNSMTASEIAYQKWSSGTLEFSESDISDEIMKQLIQKGLFPDQKELFDKLKKLNKAKFAKFQRMWVNHKPKKK